MIAKDGKPTARTRKVEEREAILALLARVANNDRFLVDLADSLGELFPEYYTLTQEELTALISGDIKKIESWVGKLDKQQATWLWCQLNQQK